MATASWRGSWRRHSGRLRSGSNLKLHLGLASNSCKRQGCLSASLLDLVKNFQQESQLVSHFWFRIWSMKGVPRSTGTELLSLFTFLFDHSIGYKYIQLITCVYWQLYSAEIKTSLNYWVTRSSIELCWTAKDNVRTFCMKFWHFVGFIFRFVCAVAEIKTHLVTGLGSSTLISTNIIRHEMEGLLKKSELSA